MDSTLTRRQLDEALLHRLPDMAAVIGAAGQLVAVNQQLCAFFGQPARVLLNTPLKQLCHCDEPGGLHGVVATALLRGRSQVDCEAVRADGHLRTLRCDIAGLQDQRVVLVLRDITEHRLLESERARFYQLVEVMQDLVCVMDQGGGILFLNPAYQTLLGYEPSALIGTSLFDYIHPRDLATLWHMLQESVETNAAIQNQIRMVTDQGQVRHLDCTLLSVRSGFDAGVEVVLIGRDSTDQHHLQQALIESQKMEGMGRLARGIAHDFNNLLQLILGSVQCLDNEDDLPESAREWHDTIRTAAERGRKLVSQLQAFSRRDVGVRLPQTLGTVLSGLTDLVRPMLTGSVTFDLQIPCEDLVVEVDAGQILQVLVNLVINACEAVQGEGQVRVLCDEVVDGGQPSLCIAVEDTGCGIPEENLSRIFEPFFSTKDYRRGTGLGLAVAYGIVEAHGGRIEADSAGTGQGSTFRLHLPLAPPGTQPIGLEQPPKFYGNDELILVVDDEPMQRVILRRQLEFLGYDVLMADDGAHAVDLFHDYADEINCVLLDVVMPRLDGRKTLAALQEIKPDVQVIVTTGLGRDESVTAMLESGALAFVAKPFRIEHLGAILHRVLHADDEPQGD